MPTSKEPTETMLVAGAVAWREIEQDASLAGHSIEKAKRLYLAMEATKDREIASPASEDVVEPFAWTFELARARTYEGSKPHGWADWGKPQLSFTKPCVPEGAVRNLRPLFLASPTPREGTISATEMRDRLLEGLKRPTPRDTLVEARDALQAMMDAWFDYHDAHNLTQPVTGAAGNAFDKALAARDNLDAILAMEATKDRKTASPTPREDVLRKLDGYMAGALDCRVSAAGWQGIVEKWREEIAAALKDTQQPTRDREALADPADLVQIAEAVAFYANPENWHGVYMTGNGPMVDDWSETDDPQYSPKPGKLAREAIAAWEAARASSASQRG